MFILSLLVLRIDLDDLRIDLFLFILEKDNGGVVEYFRVELLLVRG